jgi:hypothetical protein
MLEEVTRNANSPLMWAGCSVMVLVALWEVWWFVKTTYKVALKSGMQKGVLHESMRAAAITSIGPGFAIMIAMTSLMSGLGTPLAWQRLSVIGNIIYELAASRYGALAYGVEFGGEGYTGAVLTTSALLCASGAGGYLIIVGIFTPTFQKAENQVAKKNIGALKIFASGAMIGLFAHFCGQNIINRAPTRTSLFRPTPTLVSLALGGISVALFTIIAEKKKIKWLREWSLGLAMVIGMLCALPFVE